jgi:hypothetical protein
VKATVTVQRADGAYTAQTENNTLIVFSLDPDKTLLLGDELEVDLPTLLQSQRVIRVKDQRILNVKLRPDDIHDLDLPANHGSSRTPSVERVKK